MKALIFGGIGAFLMSLIFFAFLQGNNPSITGATAGITESQSQYCIDSCASISNNNVDSFKACLVQNCSLKQESVSGLTSITTGMIK